MEATVIFWLTVGILMTAVSLCAIRYCEHSWLAPSSLFFFAFLSHAFIAPVVLVETVSTYNPATLGSALVWSFVSQLALLAGYMAVAHRNSSIPVSPLRPLFSSIGQYLMLAVLTAALVFHLVNTVAGEGLLLVRGALAYEFDDSVMGRTALAAELLITPFCLSLLLTFPFLKGYIRWVTFLVVLSAILVVMAVALMTFGRYQAMFMLIMLLGVRHWRFKAISRNEAIVAVAILSAIALFSELRALAAAFGELSLRELMSSLTEVVERYFDPLSILLLLGTAIAGQEVFTQVLDLVPEQEPFRYGATYLESLFGVLFPRVFWGYEGISTPAFWFKEVYAPWGVGHGFDFSMLSEAYLNFGALMWIVPLLVGALVAWLSRIVRTSGSPLLVLWSVIAFFAIIRGLRTDSSGLFKMFLYPMIPIFSIIFFERLVTFSVSGARRHAIAGTTVRARNGSTSPGSIHS